MSLSVVIATHQDPLGLYLTVHAMIAELSSNLHEWEIIIAADGGTEYKWERMPNVRCLRIHTGSPQGTRDAGIRAAKYDTVLCIESHVITHFLWDWYKEHTDIGATLSFNMRVGETSELFESFGYSMDWDRSFWSHRAVYGPRDGKPYPIVSAGHACFMIDKLFYIAHGGYFLDMKGWGGEEPDLNLLVWQMGGTTWMITTSWHAHYLTPGAHAEKGDDFRRNFCIAAYEHGGAEYLHKVEGFYGYKLQRTPAIEARRQYICSGTFGGDLDKLRAYFKAQGIAD